MRRLFRGNPKLESEMKLDSWSELQTAGLRRTLPRLRILSMFQGKANLHLTAEEIYRELLTENANVGLSTVYRALHHLVQAKLITRLNFEGPALYELHEADHHDHLVCLACGMVEEFFDEKIEMRQCAISGEKGFALQRHTLTLYGHCASCQASTARRVG